MERVWSEVVTDTNGYNDLVYLTTLVQTLRLNLGESPFFANYGLPAAQSVAQQVAPDYYIALTQKIFAPFFASLLIAKIKSLPPTYQVNVLTHSGASLAFAVVPTFMQDGRGNVVVDGRGNPIVTGVSQGFLPT